MHQLSGGTTGIPKVIPRRHAEYWYNAAELARSNGWTPESRVAHLIPIIHNAGIVCAVHGPHSVGACLVLGTADLDVALPLMARAGATHVLLGSGHYGAVDHPQFAAAVAAVTDVVLSGAKVSCVDVSTGYCWPSSWPRPGCAANRRTGFSSGSTAAEPTNVLGC